MGFFVSKAKQASSGNPCLYDLVRTLGKPSEQVRVVVPDPVEGQIRSKLQLFD